MGDKMQMGAKPADEERVKELTKQIGGSWSDWFVNLPETLGVDENDPALELAIKCFLSELAQTLVKGMKDELEVRVSQLRRAGLV